MSVTHLPKPDRRWTFTDMFEAFPTIHPSAAEQADRITAEINISLEALNSHGGEDGVHGEFMVRWYDLRDGDDPVPRLEAFDDSWEALHESGLVEMFADHQKECGDIDTLSPGVLKRYLRARGYVDRTDHWRKKNAPRTDYDQLLDKVSMAIGRRVEAFGELQPQEIEALCRQWM